MPGIRTVLASSLLVAGVALAEDASVESRLRAMEARMEQLAQENQELRAEVQALKKIAPAAGPAEAPPAAKPPDKNYLGASASWKDGFWLKSDDGNFTLHPGGVLQIVSRNFISEERANDTVFVREARLKAEGTFYKDYEYFLLGDFARGAAQLQDGYVGWKRHPSLSFRIGQFAAPFTLEGQGLNSTSFMNFEERSAMNVLDPDRDIGFMFFGKAWEDRIDWSVAVINGNGKNNVSDLNDAKDVLVHLSLRPFAPSDNPWIKGITLGGALSYGEQKQTFGNLATLDSGTTYLTTVVGPGGAAPLLSGERRRLNAQAAWLAGPFKLTGEVTWLDEKIARTFAPFTRENIAFSGYYVDALYVVTGEDATIGRKRPKKNFLQDGGVGEIELAARFSRLDVDDDVFVDGFASSALSTGGYDNITAGVNWYLNPYVRVTVDYFHNEFDDPVTIRSAAIDDEDGFLTRFQIDF